MNRQAQSKSVAIRAPRPVAAMALPWIGLFLVALTLAGCGADGSPTPPGASVSGEASMGVVAN